MNTSQPNILLITCHDLGNYLGCYGVPTVRTPNLDRFASDGVRFAHAFCTAPQCSPSRASLFTGRYPHSNGVMGLTHGDFGWDLYPDEQHIGQVLQRAGYTTVMMGIHHETRQGAPEYVGERCGMDEVIPPLRGKVLVDEALRQLERFVGEDRPFYLQVGFHEPHREKSASEPITVMGFTGDDIEPDDEMGVLVPPWLIDEPSAREEMAELQGAIHYVDAAIGRLLDGLQQFDLAEHTLVIVTTDHGVALPRAKCSLYDPGIETTLLMRLPSRGWAGGIVIPSLVSNIDLFPTILATLGLPVSDRVQGHSLLPLLDRGSYAPRDHIFAEMTYHDYYDPQRCIRTERHKLIVYFSAAPAFMDPSQSWRPRTRTVEPANPAIAFHPAIALYDLEFDPYEQRNLASAAAYTDIQRDLLTRLLEWMRETNDPLLSGAVTSPSHWQAIAALRDAGPTASRQESVNG